MNLYRDQSQQYHEKPDGVVPEWRLSVYGALFDDQGRLLIAQPTCCPDKWDIPGGGIDVEESITGALEREFFEETAYQVKAELKPVYVGESDFYHSGDRKFYHSVICILPVTLRDPKRDETAVNPEGGEILDLKWVHPNDIKEEEVGSIYWPYVKSLQNYPQTKH